MLNTKLPLCVDLDGTLIDGDVTFETILLFVKHYPLKTPLLFWWILKGRAHMKTKLASVVDIRADLLPYNQKFVEFLKQQAGKGQKIILVTASDSKFAQAVAKHLGFFSDVLASDATTNLKAHKKADVLVAGYGEKQFIYAGNSNADLPVWEKSASPIAVNTSGKLLQQLKCLNAPAMEFPRSTSVWKSLLKAMRPHQWSKNALVFLPLIASHQFFNNALFVKTVSAFIAFCFCASAIYILNDLLDLESDRQHVRKKNRPFANGSLSVPFGIGASLILMSVAILIGSFAGFGFLVVLLGYIILTMLYSFGLKALAIIDVLFLAGLFTIRVVAGYAVTQVPYSNWFLAFSLFLFLSLAFMKRYIEIKALSDKREVGYQLPGRGYRVGDEAQIGRLGNVSGYLSIMVFALYTESDAVLNLYRQPMFLWALFPILIYAISNMWLQASRGEMVDDPVVFVLKDKASYIMLAMAAVVLWLATWS